MGDCGFVHFHDVKHSWVIPPEPVDEVLSGLRAGTVGALVAPGGTGKSFFCLQIAIAVVTGSPVAGGALESPKCKGRVLYFAAEEDHDVLHHRLYTLGCWFRTYHMELCIDDLLILPLVGVVPTLVNAEGTQGPWYKFVRQLVVKHSPRLVIFDPLRRFHLGDENDNGYMTLVVQYLEGLCREGNITVLASHHANKAGMSDWVAEEQNVSRGASALVDGLRWLATMRLMRKSECEEWGVEEEMRRFWVRLEIAKQNYGEPLPGCWLRRLPGGVLTKGVLERGVKTEKKNRRLRDEY